MSTFEKYSAFYDLLYLDKDYGAEAQYVGGTIRSALPDARHLLELGSGTGRHGRLLADMGFEVHGIERSADMVRVARAAKPPEGAGRFTCEVGDICSLNLGRTFDAVVSLFHVISYQTTNEALKAAFQAASAHLRPGGIFLFDVWHGPAVLSQQPEIRVKEVSDSRYEVKRTARPELDSNRSTVKVVYDMDCKDRVSGERLQFTEDHLVRYLFPPEIDLLADNAGLRRIASEEFLTRAAPSLSTWGVAYVLQK